MPVMTNLIKKDNDTRVNINGISSMHYIRTGISSNKINVGGFVDFFTENGKSYTKTNRVITKENITPTSSVVYNDINLEYWIDSETYTSNTDNTETTTIFDLLSYNGEDFKISIISDTEKNPASSYKVEKFINGTSTTISEHTMKEQFGIDYSGFMSSSVKYSQHNNSLFISVSLDNHTMYLLLNMQLGIVSPITYVVTPTDISNSYIVDNSDGYKTISGINPSFYISKTDRVVIYDNIRDLFLNETLSLDETYGEGSSLIYTTLDKYKDLNTLWVQDPVEKKSIIVYTKTPTNITVDSGQIIPYANTYLIDKTDESIDNVSILRISNNRYFLLYTSNGILKGLYSSISNNKLQLSDTVYILSSDKVSNIKAIYGNNNVLYIAYTLETNTGYSIASIIVNGDNTLSPYINSIDITSYSNTSVSNIWIYELSNKKGFVLLYKDTNALYADIYSYNGKLVSITKISNSITTKDITSLEFIDNNIIILSDNKYIHTEIENNNDVYTIPNATEYNYDDNHNRFIVLNKANRHILSLGTAKNSSIDIYNDLYTSYTSISIKDMDNISATNCHYIPLKENHYLFVYMNSDSKVCASVCRYTDTFTLYEAYTLTSEGVSAITDAIRISDNNVAIVYKESYDSSDKYQYQIQIVSIQYRDTVNTITPSDKYPFNGIVKNIYSDGSVEVIIPNIDINGSIN